MTKSRLDLALVVRGLADSRSKAAALIMAGLVYAGERKLDKAGLEISDAMELTVRGKEHPFVSRGGMKLAHALAHFALDVRGAVAADIGASTGGFTDVLLQAGAAKVYAVDVGHGQLDAKLRSDPRVIVMEETNARYLTMEMLQKFTSPLRGEDARLASGWGCSNDASESPPQVRAEALTGSPLKGEQEIGVLDLIVCDASFISLKKVLPAALALAKPHAKLVTLIKPQFEVGKAEVSRGKGVIRDARLHDAVCADIAAWIAGEGWRVVGIVESPITGPKGNKEFLLYAVR